MSFEIEGKLIEKFDTLQVTDSFKKREFVLEKIEVFNGREFIETIKFQLTQDKCSQLDNLQLNANLKVHFSIKGRKWEKNGVVNYFNNLEAWKVEAANNYQTNVPLPDKMEADFQIADDDEDELPF